MYRNLWYKGRSRNRNCQCAKIYATAIELTQTSFSTVVMKLSSTFISGHCLQSLAKLSFSATPPNHWLLWFSSTGSCTGALPLRRGPSEFRPFNCAHCVPKIFHLKQRPVANGHGALARVASVHHTGVRKGPWIVAWFLRNRALKGRLARDTWRHALCPGLEIAPFGLLLCQKDDQDCIMKDIEPFLRSSAACQQLFWTCLSYPVIYWNADTVPAAPGCVEQSANAWDGEGIKFHKSIKEQQKQWGIWSAGSDVVWLVVWCGVVAGVGWGGCWGWCGVVAVHIPYIGAFGPENL